MKKFIFALAISACFLCGCEKEKLIEPQLIVSTEALIMNEEEVTTLYLSTKPVSECDYQITAYPKWISVHPKSGTITNNIAQIEIQSLLQDSLAGIYKGEIEIMSSAGSKTISVQGTVGEVINYALPNELVLSFFADKGTFALFNGGNAALDFEAMPSNDFISLSSYSGTVDVSTEVDIEVNINRELMHDNGFYESQIFFRINNQQDTVTVTIENFAERKKMIEGEIVDAEFSNVNNSLVYVATDPRSLVIYNTIDETFTQIALDFIPTCVSVSFNGKKAVVGHDGRVSYIDIIQKKVIKTLEVPCNIFDIALKNDDWAYAINNDISWGNLYSINLENEQVHQSPAISYFASSNIRLHPSEKYLYLGYPTNITPSDIEKADVQNGIAQYLYDSHYHGDYPSGGQIWFSEDGMRIFSQYRTVFKCSESQESDILYNGTISTSQIPETTYSAIQWLDHSSITNNLYVLWGGTDWWSNEKKTNSGIYVYNATNLTYRKKLELEKYLVKGDSDEGQLHPAFPFFVFSSSSGENIYVLTKASGLGLLHEWALQKLAID